MRRKALPMLMAALALIAALCLTGCMDFEGEPIEPEPEPTPVPPLSEPMLTDEDALYRYYNEVRVPGDTLAALKERYGDPEEEATEGGTIYRWVMEDGYGFSVGTFPDGRIRGKVLHIKDLRQLGALSNSTNPSGSLGLTKDYSFAQCKSLMGGKPMQIMITEADPSLNATRSAMWVWANEDGEVAQVIFGNESRVESYYYQESVPPIEP